MRLLTVFVAAVALLGSGGCKKKAKAPRCPMMLEIVAPYPGASPAEVEQVVLAIEEAAAQSKYARSIESVAAEGLGTVFIEVDPGKIMEAKRDLLGRVDEMSQHLPPDVEKLWVTDMPSGGATQLLVISGDLAIEELSTLAEQLASELRRSENAGRVRVIGAAEREVAILVDPAKLAAYGIAVHELAATLRMAAVDRPRADGSLIRVPVGGVPASGEELMRIAIEAMPDGTVIHLGDVASLRVGPTVQRPVFYRERPAIALLVETADPVAPSTQLPAGVKLSALGSFDLRRCGADSWQASDNLAIVSATTPRGGPSLAAQWADSGQGPPVLVLGGSSLLPNGPSPVERTELVLIGKDLGPALLASVRRQPGVEAALVAPRPQHFEIELRGPELGALERSGDFIVAHLGKEESVLGVGVRPSRADRPEISIEPADRARTLGLTTLELARAVRFALHGEEVMRYQRGVDLVSVMLRLETPPDVSELGAQPIALPGGGIVPLGEVATISIGAPTRRRLRRDQQRVVIVDVTPGAATSRRDLIKTFDDELRGSLAPGVEVSIR